MNKIYYFKLFTWWNSSKSTWLTIKLFCNLIFFKETITSLAIIDLHKCMSKIFNYIDFLKKFKN